MKYAYKFLDEEESEIEVSPEMFAILTEFDDKERKNNRTETRRHFSINQLTDDGFQFADFAQGIDFVLERQDFYNKELLLEHTQRQVFSKYLTEQQADVFYRHKILRYNNSKIARQLNVTEGAIRKLLEKAKNKLFSAFIAVFEVEPNFPFDEIDFENRFYLEVLLTIDN